MSDFYYTFLSKIFSNAESIEKQANDVLDHYAQCIEKEKTVINDFLVSLCGWSFETICEKSGFQVGKYGNLIYKETDVSQTVIKIGAVKIQALKRCDESETGFKNTFIDVDELDWHKDEYGFRYLKLEEISDQLKALGYIPYYYVWDEWALGGTIYVYGKEKSGPNIWEINGVTKGLI